MKVRCTLCARDLCGVDIRLVFLCLRWSYLRRLQWLHSRHLIGVGRAYVPLIGMVTIMMNDYPMLKYLMIGSLALMVLIGNERS